jgi:hypothetical protein
MISGPRAPADELANFRAYLLRQGTDPTVIAYRKEPPMTKYDDNLLSCTTLTNSNGRQPTISSRPQTS